MISCAVWEVCKEPTKDCFAPGGRGGWPGVSITFFREALSLFVFMIASTEGRRELFDF